MKRATWVAGLCTLVLWVCISFAAAYESIEFSNSPSNIQFKDQDQSGVTMQVSVGELDMIPVQTKQGDFTLATVKGFGRSLRVGEPNLPQAKRLVSIPFGCDVTIDVLDFDVEEISLADYGITTPLVPVQESVSKSAAPEDIPFEWNQAVYETQGFYSLPMGEAEIIGEMRGVRLARVTVSPVEYNPTTNTIRVYKNIEVRVQFNNPDWSKTYDKQERYFSPFFMPIYDRIGNYEATFGEKNDLVTYPVKYLIISDRMFEAQLQPFIEWKTQKGFNVVVAYTDVIGTSNTAIKNYIEDMYDAGTTEDPAPSFVLFVGDDQQIPAFDGTSGSHITDLYFCEFTGDVIPEIYYGRFSAQSPALLQPQINKTLEYEKYLMPDPSYLDEVTLIAGVDGTYAITHGNGQINYGTNYYFNGDHGITSNTWLYPASNGSGVDAAIIQTMNEGIGFANYTAHCGHDEWSSPNINTSDLNNLVNYHKYFTAVGNCCLSNTFGSDYSTPCWGEVFLQLDSTGGVGYIGGSNSTYWDEDYWWGVGYGPVDGDGPTYEQTTIGAYDGVFHDHGEPTNLHYITNDAMLYAGNLAVTESGSRVTYYWEIYHVMGDPSVMTYMGIPDVNTVSYPSALVLGQTDITVTADPGSYVGISYDGVLHGAGFVDASGSIDITLDPFMVPCPASIVITAQNKQPHIGTIQVIAPNGPYMVYDESDIDDFAGNNNGVIDYGETVSLGIQLKNVGPDDAIAVEATLSTTDSYITITDGTESFGDINGDNGTGYVSNAFTFDVASNIPDGHIIPLSLTMTDTNDSTWTSNFSVLAHAPVLGYLAVTVNDESGNDNGVFDPGETVDLIVAIGNTGSGDANDITAVLGESDTYIDIFDGDGSYDDIVSTGSGENTFDVFSASADAGCPRGHEVTFTINVSAANGLTVPLQFTMIIGDRVVFFADDFSFDQGWTGLGGSAEWTIGAATGGAGNDSYGSADPAIDHSPTSDNGVMGNDLTSGTGGDYASSLSSTYWVTSPVIDCGDFNGCILGFWRWLGVEQNSYDHAYLQVFDGSSWVQIFANGSSTIDESSWSEQTYDVSAYADSNSAFQIRFGLGGTDGSMNWCGWNIDDLWLKGYGERKSADVYVATTEVADSLVPGDNGLQSVLVYNESEETILRISFGTNVSWLTFDTEQQLIDPSDSLVFPLTIATAGMEPGDYSGLLTYSCNDYSHQYDTIEVTLHLYAPDISVATDPLSASCGAGETTSCGFTINNVGPGRLTYAIGCQMFDGKSGITSAVKPVLEDPIGYHPSNSKGDVAEPFYGDVNKSAGGPDTYGYSWIDSDDAAGPTFEWIDISTIGTDVVSSMSDDNAVGPISMGMSFPFYDSTYNQLYIGSNGVLGFGIGATSRTNQNLPNASTPNNLIAMWWDDLDPPENGHVYYYNDVANNRFIVSYEDVRYYTSPDGAGSLTFQAILYANGQVVLQYGTMDAGTHDEGHLSSTIGLENVNGSDGLTVVYNAAYMHDNMAISFKAARWMSVLPSGGTIEPYSSQQIAVNFDASELTDGEYGGQLTVISNDGDQSSVTIPVSLSISSYTCGDADGDTSVNVGDAVFLVNYIFNGGAAPNPIAAADCNGDTNVNIADAVYLINYIFKAGPAPACQ
ncbi:MAG: C25 family cysteine peptidase [Candidatus Zixiibacteriota bacterium]